ncbi:MAG TPA: TIGR01777 family oxidoreductase [Vicinamibacterales bacterium]|nr:TIGR01777 family oxidoreductase [Vicinamibacterales bacterium]
MGSVTIVIAGGSGFLGQKLVKRLQDEGHRTAVLSRSARNGAIQWQPDGSPGSLRQHLEGVDAVVNLAGEGIADKRWTQARREALRSSRILPTRTLVRAIAACAEPPRVFISGSGIGYYGPRGDEPITEAKEPGSDFLARLCVEWEQEARIAESARTRVAIVRTGVALAADGGALKKMLLPFKLGLGATIASGDQYMPWIHADDWTAMVSWMIQQERATGAFNATAPTPVTNRDFTRTLGRVLHRPAILHAPAFAMRIALGEMSSMLEHGQRVLPAAAEHIGFRFAHRTLEPALRSLNL